MKKIIFFLFVLFLSQNSFASDLSELSQPKPFAGRIANGNKVETNKKEEIKILEEKINTTQIKKDENDINQIVEEANKNATNYADMSLKRLANDISYELELDNVKTNSDLNILWQAAAMRSETMKYTIHKLSNPDEDRPSDSVVKKILKPVASFSTLAGASLTGDPFMATGALIGGGLVNAFMKDDKEINYKFSKVSDADMVLLVRKIDDLQKKLLDLYVDYKTKQEILAMTKDNLEKREQIYKVASSKTKEELVIADVYFRNAKTSFQRAQDEYLTSRAILENLVGSDAISKIEE